MLSVLTETAVIAVLTLIAAAAVIEIVSAVLAPAAAAIFDTAYEAVARWLISRRSRRP